ncbi:hypothetical protein Q7P37_010697 [Cladosporium fusiforme]
MGRPSPKDDQDALSMHTTPDDYEYAEPSDGLPSYNDSEAAASSSAATPANTTAAPRMAPVEPYKVIPSNQGVLGTKRFSRNNPSASNEVTIRMEENLTDPDTLYGYIMDCLRVAPPRPLIEIHGWHEETVRRNNKKEKERVTDFRIHMPLEQYLSRAFDADMWQDRVVSDSESAYRGSWRKTKAPGYKPGIQLTDEPQRTLQDWCENYCASPSKLKVMRINRKVQGLDFPFLQHRLESLVRAAHYRGNTDIRFRVDEQKVDIYSPHLINQWRTNWVRWIFYLTFLWIITWPILIFTTKWWEVYTVTWYFSRDVGANNDVRKKYATINEAQWFEGNKNHIRELVVNKFQGHVECVDGSTEEEARPAVRTHTGNADVDSAVSLIRDGVGIWNAVTSGRNPNDQGWGYDC